MPSFRFAPLYVLCSAFILAATAPALAEARDEAEKIGLPPIPPAPPEPEPVRLANNSLFVELGGPGLLYSLNYERLFGDTNVGLRIGASVAGIEVDGRSATWVSIPLVGSYYLGGQDHKLQLGAGMVFLAGSATPSDDGPLLTAGGFAPYATVVVGYRYIPRSGGLNASIGVSPLVYFDQADEQVKILPWGGGSLGIGF